MTQIKTKDDKWTIFLSGIVIGVVGMAIVCYIAVQPLNKELLECKEHARNCPKLNQNGR